MKAINYLGTFNSVADAWKSLPYGGAEGDYIIINGAKIAWNKYTQNWGQGSDVTPARKTHFISGDLHVAGTVKAYKLKGQDQGLWPTEDALKEAIPSPEAGYWAAIGSGFPAPLWVCRTDGVWEDSGTMYDGGGVSLEDYDTSFVVDDKINTAAKDVRSDYNNIMSEDAYENLPIKEDKFYFTYEEES